MWKTGSTDPYRTVVNYSSEPENNFRKSYSLPNRVCGACNVEYKIESLVARSDLLTTNSNGKVSDRVIIAVFTNWSIQIEHNLARKHRYHSWGTPFPITIDAINFFSHWKLISLQFDARKISQTVENWHQFSGLGKMGIVPCIANSAAHENDVYRLTQEKLIYKFLSPKIQIISFVVVIVVVMAIARPNRAHSMPVRDNVKKRFPLAFVELLWVFDQLQRIQSRFNLSWANGFHPKITLLQEKTFTFFCEPNRSTGNFNGKRHLR